MGTFAARTKGEYLVQVVTYNPADTNAKSVFHEMQSQDDGNDDDGKPKKRERKPSSEKHPKKHVCIASIIWKTYSMSQE